MYPNQIPLSQLVLGNNPRRSFDPAEMDELTASIKEKGVIQAILVRPLNDGFEVVAGGRRYRAAMAAHGDQYEIPVTVREMSDAEAEELALIENCQRADMSPAEEAEAAAKILARCEGDREEAARRLGWTRAVIDKRLALMNCCEAVRNALVERKIKLGHAELIAGLAKDKQEGVLVAILKAPEMVTVGELKIQIQKLANALSTAIFDKSDCAGCQHNSGNQAALFGEAVDSGYCTNRECWDGKTNEALELKKNSLKDEFPETRIVRPGENFTVIKLVAEGATGVGEDQAKACRSCGKFGAAISAVPGKVGQVYKDLCFDADCNAQKVKANQAAILVESKPAQPAEATDKKAKTATVGKSDASAKKPKTVVQVQDSNRIKEYRLGIWRKALARHLASNPEQNERVLIALAMSGDAGKISSTKTASVFAALAKVDAAGVLTDPARAFALTGQADLEVIGKMRLVLAASAAETIEEHKLVKLMVALGVDLKAHWQLCEEYLNLLTKSEIEVVADQIGLKAKLDKDFTKLMSGKKDEIVKKLMAVDGFDYAGKLPQNMQFAK